MLPRSYFSSRTRFPRSGLEFPLLVITVVFLVLGSLTPFRLDAEALGRIASGEPIRFWHKLNLADVCVNWAIYIPFGASLFALMRSRFGPKSSSVLTVLCGAGLSLWLEASQLILKGRYASLWDVLFNSIGTLTGVIVLAVICRKMLRALWSLRRSFQAAPMVAMERVVVFGLLALSMAPFDFVTTPKGLQRSMQASEIPLATAVAMGRTVPGFSGSDRAWSDLVAGDFGWAVGFAVLGYLFFMRNRAEGADRLRAMAGALGTGWLLALVMEVLQLFASAHVFALPDIVVHGLGVTIGVGLGGAIDFWRVSRAGSPYRRSISNGFLACMVLGQAIVLTGPAFVATTFGEGGTGFKSGDWIPLADLLAMPFADACAELIEICCMYALLIVPLFVWLMRVAPGLAVVLSLFGAVCVAITVGIPYPGDGAVGFSTRVLTAFVAAYAAVRLTQFFYEPARCKVVVNTSLDGTVRND